MTTPVHDCIRCDFCATVCPQQLQPQQLYAFSRYQQHEQAKAFDLLQCTECGACESVCPSHLPLLDFFRDEKLAILAQERADAQASHWQQRFERHQARSHHDALAQQERKLKKLQAKTKDLAEGKTISRHRQPAADAATLVAAKTPQQIQTEIAAAVARTRARKAALQAGSAADDSVKKPAADS
jgi:electron transport complex protein RnfC